MREEVVRVYKFEELSNKAKEVAREWMRNCINEDFSHEAEMITEDFKYQLEELGYPTDDVEWSLSCCQGDGVAFYGSIDDDMMDKIVKRADINYELYNLIREYIFTISANLYRNSFGHHYSHWNTMNVEMDGDNIDHMVEEIFELDYEDDREEYEEKFNEIENLIESIESFIDDEIKRVSKKLEKEGYEQIDYFLSDEAIDDTIVANNYEFEEDGSRW